MTDWNFADTWEEVARHRPDAPALIQGPLTVTWADLDRRADALAAGMLAAGVGPQGRVAQYLYNGPAYIESVVAAFKAGLVPVNTNYRYTAAELFYLWDNADVDVVVFDRSFTGVVEEVRTRLPRVRAWVLVDGAAPAAAVPGWAVAYEALAGADRNGADHAGAAPPPDAGPAEGLRAPWGRSGDDLLLIYTGGTTGMPKGVMWRQDDLWVILNRASSLRYPVDGGLAGIGATLELPTVRPVPRLLPGPPLMHGTGLFTALSTLACGGALVLLEGRRFSAVEMLDTIDAHRVTEASIVGDAFARPLLAELDAHPGRWDLSSLWLMVSSGVMWSAEVRSGLLAHLPGLTLVDALGSSEAIGMARSRSGKGRTPSTAGFQLGEGGRVVTEDGRDVEPGSGEAGRVALRGRGPVGYHKDAEKTATTFQIVDGERWTMPGDWALVEADGTVRLLGRGSGCINTGGEKVFPEEVEESLKRHPTVADAAVVGVPDERFGEVVVALVEPAGDGPVDAAELTSWVKGSLASYKAPRVLLPVATVGRAPNGKLDYKALRGRAVELIGATGS